MAENEKNINEDLAEEETETVASEEAAEKVAAEETVEDAKDTAESDVEKEDDKKKNKKKDKKDQLIEELTDKYKRSMAEFENYRRRTEKEKAAMFEIGAKSIIEKLLPVVDNFERGLSSISEEEKTSSAADGMDKIYKQLTKMLSEAGVNEIEAEGAEFNPDFHNAVMHVDDEELGENVVAEVLQKGYTYKDSVVRHSMVKVAN